MKFVKTKREKKRRPLTGRQPEVKDERKTPLDDMSDGDVRLALEAIRHGNDAEEVAAALGIEPREVRRKLLDVKIRAAMSYLRKTHRLTKSMIAERMKHLMFNAKKQSDQIAAGALGLKAIDEDPEGKPPEVHIHASIQAMNTVEVCEAIERISPGMINPSMIDAARKRNAFFSGGKQLKLESDDAGQQAS